MTLCSRPDFRKAILLLIILLSVEGWLGLEKLHQLTSEGSYSLRITMKDFDGKIYVAVYDQFQVIKIYDDERDCLCQCTRAKCHPTVQNMQTALLILESGSSCA